MRINRAYQNKVHLWLIVGVALLANCQGETGEPVALEPQDMCDYCKMAISEKRYAAEVIDNEGRAFKFDDISCLANFTNGRKNTTKVVAHFVMDFDERQWIKAEDAYYVRSTELTTPMNGNIIAFRSESQARQAADKYNGKLLRLTDILR
jgi:copper chaperone NosL